VSFSLSLITCPTTGRSRVGLPKADKGWLRSKVFFRDKFYYFSTFYALVHEFIRANI